MSRLYIAVCCFLLMVSGPTLLSAAQKKSFKNVNVGQMARETQKQAQTPTVAGKAGLRVAWWIPVEYWQASMGSRGQVPDAAMKQMIRELSPYYIVAIVQADVSTFGAFDFYSKEEISRNFQFKFVNQNGRSKILTPIKKLNGNLTLLLQNMKPILSAAMGNLGRNFHFYAFSDVGSGNKRVLSPYKPGVLQITLKDRNGGSPTVLKIDTLLDSLHVPRKCSNGKNAHVSWNYCPWDGKKL